jgi:LacI family transcriptional regulator
MAVTIKEIAAATGVSRGTVDRVLHNRKDVNPDVAQQIRELADKMGYIPNRAGKILAARKQQIRFGCMLPDEGNPFFDKVIDGFRRAESELKDYGVTVDIIHLRGFNVQTHIDAIKKMAAAGYNGICLTTLDVPEIQKEIYTITQRGTPVVSVNTDIPDSGRICYVGTDYIKAGRTAAGMLSLISKEKQKILIVSGSFQIRGHNERIRGFKSGLEDHRIAYDIVDTVEAFDDNEDSYKLTRDILLKHPEITSIFVVAGGVPGAYRAVKELDRNKIIILAFDELPEIKQAMKEGGIGFTIGQEPELQGYTGVMRLFSWLMEEGKKQSYDYITQTIIKIADNM